MLNVAETSRIETIRSTQGDRMWYFFNIPINNIIQTMVKYKKSDGNRPPDL